MIEVKFKKVKNNELEAVIKIKNDGIKDLNLNNVKLTALEYLAKKQLKEYEEEIFEKGNTGLLKKIFK